MFFHFSSSSLVWFPLFKYVYPVSLAFILVGEIHSSRAIGYLIAQMLGAVAGAAMSLAVMLSNSSSLVQEPVGSATAVQVFVFD